MKHWQETAAILDRVFALAEAGREAAVATVVRITGSAYRRPGAKLLVEQGGTTHGSVSGGCLEADVREVALSALREGPPRLLHYDTGSDDRTVWGLGLGCNGSVDVFVQRATTPAALQSARCVCALLARDEAIAVATVLEGPRAGGVVVAAADGSRASGSIGDGALERAAVGVAAEQLTALRTAVRETPDARVFVEVLQPPPRLVVFGAGDDAIPLVHYAAGAGFRVTVVDHRPALLASDRFPVQAQLVLRRPEEGPGALPLTPDTCAVVKTHSLAIDREWLRHLLASDVSYLGLLGPRPRCHEILRQLGAAPDARIFGPVGLDLGAEGPEQVALSIIAELLAARAGREPRHLRSREGAIHAT